MEESADDHLDGVEENNKILNEENPAVEEKSDEMICGPLEGNGHEEERHPNQVTDEEKVTTNEIDVDRAEDVHVPLSRQTVEVSEVNVGIDAACNVGVAENEVVPEEEKERKQDEFGNKSTEVGKETKSLEVAAKENMNINEGMSASEHGITEQKLADNVQNEEANKVNAKELVETPIDNGKIECAGQVVGITNDVGSVTEKIDRPKRKVVKKKMVKKKVLVRDDLAPMDEAKLQSSTGDEASAKAEKILDKKENAYNEEMAVPVDTGVEMESSDVGAEENMNINESISASEHGMMEEKLAAIMHNKENKVNAEEPVGNEKTECTGEEASITNDVQSVTGNINRPKRKVLKKKVVKKKMVVRNGVAPVEEPKSQSSVGGEASGEADKAYTNEDVKNAENSVTAGNRKIKLTGGEASISDNVKVDPQKVNGCKRKVLKKKVVQKLVLQDAVALANEAKPQCSIENDATGEAKKTDKSEDVENEDKAELKPAVRVNKKLKRITKKKMPESHANIATAGGEQKLKVTNDKVGKKEDKETDVQVVKNEEAAKAGDRVSGLKKRKKKKKMKEDTHKTAADGINNCGSSQKSKPSQRTDSMGMIFMCSSETKKDCYHYKVLGLPANKKDIVSKIYKGMRLFLFDFDLRMMYGIYKAAGPGGYNIEPRAFRSQFPSQVRFTVLKDCLPLPEEMFKKVIKDNYYTKNKFNCQLTNDQVKNLCKLFTETTERERKPAARTQISAAPSSSGRDRKRKRAEDSRKAERINSRKVGRITSLDLERSRRRAQEVRHAPVSLEPERSRRRAQEEVRHALMSLELERSRRQAQEDVRHASTVIDDRYHHRPVVYEREAYLSPAPPRTIVYQHLPAHTPPRTSSYSYDYEEASRLDIYRGDSILVHRPLESALDHRRLDRPSSRDWEPSVPAPRNVDPYVPYGEIHAYREPLYETSVRREAAYEATSVRPAEYYRARAAEYRPPLPPYRRY